LRALKGKRQLTMLFVETTGEAAAASALQAFHRVNPLEAAGAGADAHYLFAEDVLGYTSGHRPHHAKVYRNFRAEYERLQKERIVAFKQFRAGVATGENGERQTSCRNACCSQHPSSCFGSAPPPRGRQKQARPTVASRWSSPFAASSIPPRSPRISPSPS
jgi:hypothetical protein